MPSKTLAKKKAAPQAEAPKAQSMEERTAYLEERLKAARRRDCRTSTATIWT